MPKIQASVAELGALHDGVVTQGDLVAAGHHHSYAHHQTRAGRWQRLAHGIYLPTSETPTLYQRCFAASLHAGPTGIITGAAGLALRGIPTGTEQTEVTVLVPVSAGKVHSGNVRVITTRAPIPHQALQRPDRAELLVAHPTRCAADAIRRAPDLSAARSIGVTVLRDLNVDWTQLQRFARRPGPGAGHLSRVAREIADGVRSPPEAEVHSHLLKAAGRGALPAYLLNPDVYVDGELLGSPDVWFPGLGLGDEIDSRQWHEGEYQLDRTLLRHERYRLAGLTLAHITPARFAQDPRAHLASLACLVAERQALIVPEPPGLRVLGRGPLLPHRTPWPQVDPSRWR